MDDALFAAAEAAVDAALAAGATYADARVDLRREQGIRCRDGHLETINDSEHGGVGVRALIGSSWGFAATHELDGRSAEETGARAAATARASSRVASDALQLAEVGGQQDHWETPVEIDPFRVAVSDKVDLLVRATTAMHAVDGVAQSYGYLTFWEIEKYFVSSEGHRISQRLVESGGGIEAHAIGEQEVQRRSYPQSFGDYRTGGWEVVQDYDLAGNADRIADEAVALLTAPQCPSGTTDLILGGSQVALQIHESVGHATELDRILGWEAAFAGTSFLDLSDLGSFRYGSDLMTITADATIPGALGTFGYDDEGTPAQSVDIVRDGTWVGVLSGRDTAHLAGLPPGGMVRADGFDKIPMVRMTNIGLVAGPSSLEEIIADTDDGIYMTTNRSWSIDDRRLNFQFGCEAAWEVKNGELGRMLRNPTYTGITPRFWGSMDRLAGGDDWRAWGTPNCGKGQPLQVAHTAHHAAPARFRDVRVGVQR